MNIHSIFIYTFCNGIYIFHHAVLLKIWPGQGLGLVHFRWWTDSKDAQKLQNLLTNKKTGSESEKSVSNILKFSLVM